MSPAAKTVLNSKNSFRKGCAHLLEKIKSLLLVFLILLSIVLTYQLWFGRPPLEKGAAARYEYAYFTPPPHLPEIIPPAEIIFLAPGNTFLYQRGEKEYLTLWQKGLKLLTEKMALEKARRISKESKDAWPAVVSPTLVYCFRPAVPLENFMEAPANMHVDVDRVMLSWGEKQLDIFLEGEDLLFHVPVTETIHSKTGFLPAGENPCMLLPPLITLDNGQFSLINGEEKKQENMNTGGFLEDTGEGTGAESLMESDKESFAESNEPAGDGSVAEVTENGFPLSLKINVSADIYVPLNEISAAEISLKKEELQQEQLVRAFFLDLSMARRIEERDGALYFTNGEKGLRLYPSGLLEYSAPQLDRTPGNMPYSAALQKGAENLCLYGGWPAGVYLYEAEKYRGGYKFLWRTFFNGFSLAGENVGGEMIVNRHGVSFYRRFFYTFGEEITEWQPFRPYTEAIMQALRLNKDRLADTDVVHLLALMPVYYFSEGEKLEKAVPAWYVNFAETGGTYLHWYTLEPLV